LGSYSQHPVAQAIVTAARERGGSDPPMQMGGQLRDDDLDKHTLGGCQ
jgi:hypothetical protein